MFRFITLGLFLLSWSVSSQSMEPVHFSGTWASAAYFNNAIDVISETVNIDITDDANNAGYTVSYKLYNNREGLQFPLVFEVFDEFGQSNEFEITVDGQSVPVVTVTEDNNGLETSDFYIPANTGLEQFRADSKYINLDLSSGLHTITATYDVQPHYYGSDWTGISTYSYSLVPMKESVSDDKQFKGSFIKLNFNGSLDYISIGIDGTKNTLPSNNQWHFKDNLTKEIDFTIQAPLNPVAKVLTAVSPFITISFALFVLGGLHLRMMKRRQQAQPETLWTVMLVGGFLVPLLSLIIYYLYLLVTDMIIGQGATGESRDLFFIWVLPLGYIVITPIYLIISFVVFMMVKQTVTETVK
ncbi:hypothetical protein [Psychrobacter sp. JCM 18902]|uniref:hypothetical protein n=1 Tax=Psychrobacter sp. JCM 18902 TaxID=1298607 RepID=UPI00191A5A44|nr:hypothetical protein [Psychrobacter sp. JCM 18902]